jgi:hypothetical protein
VPGWRSGQATVIAEVAVTDEALMSAVRAAGYRALVRQRRPLEGERRAPKPEGGDYDLTIIGGGSAAFAAAIKGAELGANVAIVEGSAIGGTCVNIGCVPSKTLIKAAELCYRSAYPKFEGLTACPPPSDWQRELTFLSPPRPPSTRQSALPARQCARAFCNSFVFAQAAADASSPDASFVGNLASCACAAAVRSAPKITRAKVRRMMPEFMIASFLS